MKQVILNGTDLTVSNLCLGAGGFNLQSSKETSYRILDAFLDGGGNFIDTANVYGKWNGENSSEQLLGDWLKNRKGAKVVIATKGAHYDLKTPEISRVTEKDIRADVEESLSTLGLETIDFYWLHRDNPVVPVEEIIEMMEAHVKAGNIRYYGASNYSTERLQNAAAYAAKHGYRGFSAVSNRWSTAAMNDNAGADPTLVGMTPEEFRWHIDTQVPIVPYTAGAKGFFAKLALANPEIKDGVLLTPPEKLGLPEQLVNYYLNNENIRMFLRLQELRDETGHSLQELALAVLMAQPFQVIPITATGNVEHLEELFRAARIDRETLKGKIQLF